MTKLLLNWVTTCRQSSFVINKKPTLPKWPFHWDFLQYSHDFTIQRPHLGHSSSPSVVDFFHSHQTVDELEDEMTCCVYWLTKSLSDFYVKRSQEWLRASQVANKEGRRCWVARSAASSSSTLSPLLCLDLYLLLALYLYSGWHGCCSVGATCEPSRPCAKKVN